MDFQQSILNWKWVCYIVPMDWEIPPDTILNGSIAVSGRITVTGEEFAFNNDFSIDFKDKVSANEKIILTGTFCAENSGTFFVGTAAASKWKLCFNGVVRIDGRQIGNNEFPFSFNNHILRLDHKTGENQLIMEMKGNPAGMLWMLKILPGIECLTMKYGPFVSFPDSSENAVSVIFCASRPSPAAVDFRKKGGGKWKRVYDNIGGQMRHDRPIHHIRLENLDPDSEYEYRAVLIDDHRELLDILPEKTEIFRTAPSDGKPFRFLLTADLQHVLRRLSYLERLLKRNSEADFDFFVFAGDILWTSDFDRSVMDEFIVPFQKYSENRMPLVMVRGNHEIYGKDSNRYFDYFTPPPPGREGYYMFRWGETCFIVLDFCDDDGNMPPPSTRQFHDFEPYIAAEAKWLKTAVDMPMCRDAKYRIVLAHGVPLGDVNSYMPDHVRQVIDPVFGGSDPQLKIHLYLGGHIHRAFRSIPGKNSCYSAVDIADLPLPHPKIGELYNFPVVITGGPGRTDLPESMFFSSIAVEVNKECMTVSSIDMDGCEFDRISIAPDGTVTELFRRDDFKYCEY